MAWKRVFKHEHCGKNKLVNKNIGKCVNIPWDIPQQQQKYTTSFEYFNDFVPQTKEESFTSLRRPKLECNQNSTSLTKIKIVQRILFAVAWSPLSATVGILTKIVDKITIILRYYIQLDTNLFKWYYEEELRRELETFLKQRSK